MNEQANTYLDALADNLMFEYFNHSLTKEALKERLVKAYNFGVIDGKIEQVNTYNKQINN